MTLQIRVRPGESLMDARRRLDALTCGHCGGPVLRRMVRAQRKYCGIACRNGASDARRETRRIEARMAKVAAWQRWQRNRNRAA